MFGGGADWGGMDNTFQDGLANFDTSNMMGNQADISKIYTKKKAGVARNNGVYDEKTISSQLGILDESKFDQVAFQDIYEIPKAKINRIYDKIRDEATKAVWSLVAPNQGDGGFGNHMDDMLGGDMDFGGLDMGMDGYGMDGILGNGEEENDEFMRLLEENKEMDLAMDTEQSTQNASKLVKDALTKNKAQKLKFETLVKTVQQSSKNEAPLSPEMIFYQLMMQASNSKAFKLKQKFSEHGDLSEGIFPSISIIKSK